jgi:SAM-dependent methyltransferase
MNFRVPKAGFEKYFEIGRLFAGRAMVLKYFEEQVLELVLSQEEFRCAVVGGGHDEVELTIARKHIANLQVTSFDIVESPDVTIDLNEPDAIPNIWKGKFDLVICSQVLEHVWNVSQAIANLSVLLKKGGHIWINAPASNIKHGGDWYFSAGYQSSLLSNLSSLNGITEISRGEIGSERLYMSIHKQGNWPKIEWYRNPFLRGFQSRQDLLHLRFLKFFPTNLSAWFWNPKEVVGSELSTESWFYGEKINDHA